MKHLAKWGLTAPAMTAVVLFLLVPVIITIAATFAEPKGVFSPYVAFFTSGFRRTVLYRTIEVALVTTAISSSSGSSPPM